MPRAEDAHHAMVDRLIARGSLWSPALIAAFRATPRHLFLDRIYQQSDGVWRLVDLRVPSDDDLRLIYADRAVPTRLGPTLQTEAAVAISSSSQPSLMAQMLEHLHLRPGLRVLEIGAGTGYNAALLSHVVGPLASMDVDREVLTDAARHLSNLPDRQVRLHHADGRIGLPALAPFDRIQVTAASEDLEPAWLEQLTPGGIVQAPLDLGPGMAWLVQGAVRDGLFEGRLTQPAYFMPLRNEGEPGRDRNDVPDGFPGPETLAASPAPWANWSERRGGAEPGDFLPAVAFLGWLEGLTLHYASCEDSHACHGLADLVRGEACWLGRREWRITGKAGRHLGERLWRRWLDLGGPRPDEWRLFASREVSGLPEADGSARASHLCHGPRCARLWELPEPRRRGMGE